MTAAEAVDIAKVRFLENKENTGMMMKY